MRLADAAVFCFVFSFMILHFDIASIIIPIQATINNIDFIVFCLMKTLAGKK
jgi:hypothetical protein